MKKCLIASFVLAGLAASSVAAAQDDEETAFIIDSTTLKEEKEDSIDWRLISGATFTLQDNQNVVGQVDGTSVGFGFKLDTGIDFRFGDHEWRNSLNVLAGMNRTPAIDRFVKSQDNLDLETIYLYHINDWFGVFGRFAYNTTMFRGADVRAEPTDYVVNQLDGNTRTVNQVLTLGLTDPFLPSRFRESLGLFTQPYKSEPVALEVRLGGGARQTLAEGQLAIDDDEDTEDVVEVKELDDLLQVGAEAALEVWGSFDEKRVTYKLAAEAMTPFYNNQNEPPPNPDGTPGEKDTAFELTNINLKATLSVKLVEWASLDYEFGAIREPQLIDTFQIRNNLLLTFGIATGSPKKEEKTEE